MHHPELPAAHTVEDAKTTVVKRLQSLANTHALLIDKQWQGADIAEIVRTEPYTDRMSIDGPSVILTAQNFALAIHELATNAAKYGALSTQDGQVRITWVISEAGAGGASLFTGKSRAVPKSVPQHQRNLGE